MAYGIQIEVWGDRALFTRPELSVERMTYDVMTPSAARGIIESIFWHPGLRVVIDQIHVLNEIKFSSLMRNEVKSKGSYSKAGNIERIYTGKDRTQRSSLILTDVHYVIFAHFDMTNSASADDNPGKFKDMFRRRLEKGQCYSTPYFGTREFPAKFKAYTEALPPVGFYSDSGDRDLGLMLFDMDFSNSEDITPIFFRAIMRNGVIDVADSEVFR